MGFSPDFCCYKQSYGGCTLPLCLPSLLPAVLCFPKPSGDSLPGERSQPCPSRPVTESVLRLTQQVVKLPRNVVLSYTVSDTVTCAHPQRRANLPFLLQDPCLLRPSTACPLAFPGSACLTCVVFLRCVWALFFLCFF